MLRERVITALLLAPLLLWVVLWSPSSITVAIITAVILLGGWEWSQFIGWSSRPARATYAVVIAAATFFAAGMLDNVRSDGSDSSAITMLLVAAVWWIFALAWLLLFPLRTNGLVTAAAGIFVLTPTWVALVSLHNTAGIGRQLLLFLLVLVVAADVAAYFAGRAFGRVKLAPRISPGKTWEGAIGGVAGASVIAFIGANWFHLAVFPFMSLCLAVTIASIIGDLTESMFKRCVGLKDSGSILPGHGGILDRMDSITAAAPLFALGMIWMGQST